MWNIQKQKPTNQIETQNIENRNTTESSTAKEILTQEDRKKVRKENNDWK